MISVELLLIDINVTETCLKPNELALNSCSKKVTKSASDPLMRALTRSGGSRKASIRAQKCTGLESIRISSRYDPAYPNEMQTLTMW